MLRINTVSRYYDKKLLEITAFNHKNNGYFLQCNIYSRCQRLPLFSSYVYDK
jgi:hypothetical protein